MSESEKYIPCCEVFKEIIFSFSWMTTGEGKDKFYCMPYIPISVNKWRVNNCPSCGKEIRNIRIPHEIINYL